MATSTYMLACLLIGLLITLKPTLGAELLHSTCLPTSSNFTSPTQFNTNLNALLKTLTSQSTLASTGFTMGSMGRADTQRAYGLINCRADITSSDCKTCGYESIKAARNLCRGSQGAILWYDICTLKYSDNDFLGIVDTWNQYVTSSSGFVSGDVVKFKSRVTDLLTKLSKKAMADPKLFAMAKTKADPNTTVHGMVECTRDLSGADCRKCLQEVVGDFNLCCYGSKGGRVIVASCMFRFEVYPF